MSYPRYPAYKDSGVEWLGQVPEHWEIRPLGNIAHNIQTGPFGSQLHAEDYIEGGIPVINPANIQEGLIVPDITSTITEQKAQELLRHRMSAGDIVFGRRGEMGRCAEVALEQSGWICGTGSLRVEIDQKLLLSKFALLVLSNQGVKAQLELEAVGSTMSNLNTTILSRLRVPLPPIYIQIKIINFLDRETARIDTLIAKQEELIATLHEKRRALISHAVTKGLDPAAPMKASGVAWLGEVPEHWEVKRLKDITAILRGKFTHRPRNDPALYDGPYPFIQTGDVASSEKFIQQYSQTLNEKGFAVSKEFPAGTLVMTIAANIGDVAILNFDACFPDSIVGFVPQTVSLDFLYSLLTAMKPIMLSTATLNTQMNLNIERIGTLYITLPPLSEQQVIVQYLDRETARIDTLIAKAQEFIAVLREHRTALIAAAVTGQIDVREASN